ncbi:hypothetical protein EQG49_09010 [Periweissella cryptocerci]|uniref:Uncharacterized protein n=1 Tax=Periweissella cryptocerci TaxID=2506420 RepID=A0A4P6YV47_9LACO|nr:hypothetical protein [Periweissella cryptocerci]QBO36603.1 hypothetical protein EQG49_09010 [Periweissella cryptocerci]
MKMKKIIFTSVIAILLAITLIPSTCNASSSVLGKAGVSERTEGNWKKLSTKKQIEIKKNIPKKYRGTWYAWNVLANRKERIRIDARSFQYAYRNKNGRYVVLDQYSGNRLATWKTKYNHLSVNYILKTKKNNQYKIFEENFTLSRTKKGVRITLPSSWIEMINHNTHVTFRKKLKRPAMVKNNMTKEFLSKKTLISRYFKSKDVYYMMSFNKKMTHMLFNSQSIWSNSGPDIGNDVADLSAGGDSSGYGVIEKVTFKGNRVTLIVLAPASMVKTYYKIQLERISKQYIVVTKIEKGQNSFNGNKVNRTPSLFGIRFVPTGIYKN